MNPAAIMKMMGLKKTFEQNHPGVSGFVKNVMAGGIPEGSVLEISVKKPDGTELNTNMKVLASDLELVNELRNLSM